MGYTSSLDSTGPLDAGKHWLYRVIASYEKAPTWRQFDWSKNYYIFPSLTYRLDENTEAVILRCKRAVGFQFLPNGGVQFTPRSIVRRNDQRSLG